MLHNPDRYKIDRSDKSWLYSEAKISSLRDEFEHAENDFPIATEDKTDKEAPVYSAAPNVFSWKVEMFSREVSTGDGAKDYEAYFAIYEPTLFSGGKKITVSNASGAGWNALDSVIASPVAKDGTLYCQITVAVSASSGGGTTKEVESAKLEFVNAGTTPSSAPSNKEYVRIPICKVSGSEVEACKQIHAGVLTFDIGGSEGGGGGGGSTASTNPDPWEVRVFTDLGKIGVYSGYWNFVDWDADESKFVHSDLVLGEGNQSTFRDSSGYEWVDVTSICGGLGGSGTTALYVYRIIGSRYSDGSHMYFEAFNESKGQAFVDGSTIYIKLAETRNKEDGITPTNFYGSHPNNFQESCVDGQTCICSEAEQGGGSSGSPLYTKIDADELYDSTKNYSIVTFYGRAIYSGASRLYTDSRAFEDASEVSLKISVVPHAADHLGGIV